MKKIITIVGARPQFIKLAPVSRELKRYFHEIILHTGQHYDDNMSDIFFRQLDISPPDINLGVGSASHAIQTANMLIKLEEVFIREKPSLIIIFGDTNSTLAAALAAVKLHIPIAHIEAGLRNFDLSIPEEVNRVVADRLSNFLYAPTKTATNNLENEGITENVYLTGDVMFDTLLYALEKAERLSHILNSLNILLKQYCLVTIHRAENTDNINNLKEIILALGMFDETVVFPIHPRTKKVIEQNQIEIPSNVKIIPSVGYLDFITLESNARMIVTDSGGVQREAYCLKVPCLTIFPSTSWVETVDDGWNKLADAKVESIIEKYNSNYNETTYNNHFGDGNASIKIVESIKRLL